jgi:tRNA-dihydrouridine synthase
LPAKEFVSEKINPKKFDFLDVQEIAIQFLASNNADLWHAIHKLKTDAGFKSINSVNLNIGCPDGD